MRRCLPVTSLREEYVDRTCTEEEREALIKQRLVDKVESDLMFGGSPGFYTRNDGFLDPDKVVTFAGNYGQMYDVVFITEGDKYTGPYRTVQVPNKPGTYFLDELYKRPAPRTPTCFTLTNPLPQFSSGAPLLLEPKTIGWSLSPRTKHGRSLQSRTGAIWGR